MQTPEDLYFFSEPEQMRQWLEENHASEKELWVGFHHKKTGKPTLTWPQSVEEALCFGWIDGIRKNVGNGSYTIRFTPRKKGSIWSNVNIELAEKLIAEKRMRPAGLQAYEQRKEHKSGIYSYEKEPAKLTEEFQREFIENKAAWDYFRSKAPGYQRTAIHWVMQAKQEQTRQKRFQILLSCSAEGKTIPPLTR